MPTFTRARPQVTVCGTPISDPNECDYQVALFISTNEGTMGTHATTIIRTRRRDFEAAIKKMISEGWTPVKGTSKHRFRYHEATLTMESSSD